MREGERGGNVSSENSFISATQSSHPPPPPPHIRNAGLRNRNPGGCPLCVIRYFVYPIGTFIVKLDLFNN